MYADGTTNNLQVAASPNKGPAKMFQLKNTDTCVRFMPADISAVIRYRNGKTQKREINYGSSFLSQSARIMLVNKNMAQVDITDNKGNKRTLRF